MRRGRKLFLVRMGILAICWVCLAVALFSEVIAPLPISLLNGKRESTLEPTNTARASAAPTGTAALAPSLTETPTSTPNPSPQGILEFFPLHLGSSWTYNYSQRVANGADPEKVNTVQGSFTHQVEFVQRGDSGDLTTISVRRTGTPPSTEPSTFCYEETFWYLAEGQRLFLACSSEDLQVLNQARQAETETGVMSDDLLWAHVYSVPLQVGDKWGGFGGIPELGEEFCDYQWCVEAQEAVIVPAGRFENCYRLALRTNPDATFRWICPGVGLVAAEYFHFGALNEVRVELVAFAVEQ